MSYQYHQGELLLSHPNLEARPLLQWAQQQNNPFYLYDLRALKKRYQAFAKAVSFLPQYKIHFAVKANHNPEVLSCLRAEGSGVDIVSGGELRRVLDCGFSGEDILFSGVGKTEDEIIMALQHDVGQINVESVQEIERIARLAEAMKKKAPIALRLNPGVNPETHPYIITGFRDNKFGINTDELPQIKLFLKAHTESLNLVGLTMHIGSQIINTESFKDAADIIFQAFGSFQREGWNLQTLDIGGGMGIHYKELEADKDLEVLAEYAQHLKILLSNFSGRVLFEPGRFLAARCGVLISQVQYTKETAWKNFAICSAGMHMLPRPSLYQAYHNILPLKESTKPKKLYDIVGPICESSDVLGYERLLPELQQGDWLAIMDCGAYGATMASQYNLHPLPKEVVVD